MKRFLRFLSYVLVAAMASCLTLITVPWTQESAYQTKLDQLSQMIQD